MPPWLSRQRKKPRGDLLAALDVGSSKIVCFIAQVEEEGQLRVTGIGHQISEGVRAGTITDMDAAQRAILAAVSTAEQMAGETIQQVTINISGGHIASRCCQLELPLQGREIAEQDLTRILTQAPDVLATEAGLDVDGQQEILHAIPVGYSLDGQRGIRDPRGMVGHTLGVHLHMITAGFGPARTLATAVARCHLDVDQIAVSAYASGLACLVEDEMDLGSVIVDMGAGTTNFAVFSEGQCVFTDGIQIGGAHVTNDIARGLTTPLTHAERMKTLYGNALSSSTDEREILNVPQIGEEDPAHAIQVPKAQLIRIIQPRLEEIFELIRAKLESSGFGEVAGRRVVLTGGASQMPGLRDMAQRILDKQVRMGRPVRIGRPLSPRKNAGNGHASQGLAEATAGPAFATVAGLLAVAAHPSICSPFNLADSSPTGIFGKINQWVRQNL